MYNQPSAPDAATDHPSLPPTPPTVLSYPPTVAIMRWAGRAVLGLSQAQLSPTSLRCKGPQPLTLFSIYVMSWFALHCHSLFIACS